MLLTVLLPSGAEHQLDVADDSICAEILAMIEQVAGLAADQQQLTLNGMPLDPGAPIAAYGMTAGMTIVVCPKGGELLKPPVKRACETDPVILAEVQKRVQERARHPLAERIRKLLDVKAEIRRRGPAKDYAATTYSTAQVPSDEERTRPLMDELVRMMDSVHSKRQSVPGQAEIRGSLRPAIPRELHEHEPSAAQTTISATLQPCSREALSAVVRGHLEEDEALREHVGPAKGVHGIAVFTIAILPGVPEKAVRKVLVNINNSIKVYEAVMSRQRDLPFNISVDVDDGADGSRSLVVKLFAKDKEADFVKDIVRELTHDHFHSDAHPLSKDLSGFLLIRQCSCRVCG